MAEIVKNYPIDVGVILGSVTDEEKARPAKELLEKQCIPFGSTVASAHRTPDKARRFTTELEARGCKVILVFAGAAAHLGGVIAAETILPVIAVPIASSPLLGLDSLLSTVQMPPGIPVATMAINGAENAVLFAMHILAISDKNIAAKLMAYRRNLAAKVEKGAEKLAKDLGWPR